MTRHNETTRLLLIDDHPWCGTGCACAWKPCPAWPLSARPATPRAAFLRGCLAEEPDGGTLPHLALMDLNMPGVGGLELAAQLHERYPQIAVLVLSMHDNPEYMLQAVRARARYLLKDEPAQEIITAIDAVAGRSYFSAAVAVRLSQASAPPPC